MPNGGTLTIETANVELDEHYAAMHSAVKPGAYVALTVTDSGIGMSPDVMRASVRAVLHDEGGRQGHRARAGDVHGIVARSGGSVNVYSEVGQAHRSRCIFLRSARRRDRRSRHRRHRVERGGYETVLVVEDSDGVARADEAVIANAGLHRGGRRGRRRGASMFDETPSIDVLLTDVVMPGRADRN